MNLKQQLGNQHNFSHPDLFSASLINIGLLVFLQRRTASLRNREAGEGGGGGGGGGEGEGEGGEEYEKEEKGRKK